MLNIVYSEFLKLKKSYMMIILILCAVFIPVIMLIMSLSNDYSGISGALKETLIKTYRTNIEISCFQILYIILFSLLAAYIFSREFTDKTENILYTYPTSRPKIFAGKLLTLCILIIFTYAVQLLATYITLFIAWQEMPSKNFIFTDIKVNIYSALLQLIWIPVPILLANVTKNIIFPVIFGVIGAIISPFITMAGIYMQCSPLMLPALPVYYFHRGDPIDYILTVSSAVITFGLFMGLSLYHCNRMDIN
jgi:bacitracin transport system permease protein